MFVQLGLVKRRCEADSRWLPPDFGNCVSSDYQSLYDKVNEAVIFFNWWDKWTINLCFHLTKNAFVLSHIFFFLSYKISSRLRELIFLLVKELSGRSWPQSSHPGTVSADNSEYWQFLDIWRRSGPCHRYLGGYCPTQWSNRLTRHDKAGCRGTVQGST